MPKNTQMSNDALNAQGDVLARKLDNGYIRIYSGAQPANAQAAIVPAVNTLLAEARFAATSAPGTANGVITFNPIANVTVSASGTAAWFRCLKADGTTVEMDGTVDTAVNNPNMVVTTTAFVAGATLSISGFTHSVLAAATGN